MQLNHFGTPQEKAAQKHHLAKILRQLTDEKTKPNFMDKGFERDNLVL